MDEQKLPDDQFRADPPEPLPLTPMRTVESGGGGHLTRNLFIVAGIGCGLYLLIGNNTQGCRGATRSSKLRWEQQQVEMDRAAIEAASNEVVLGESLPDQESR